MRNFDTLHWNLPNMYMRMTMKSAVIAGIMTAFLLGTAVSADEFTRIIDGRERVFEELYYDEFRTNFDNWRPEGNIEIAVNSRKLEIDARNGMGTVWLKEEFRGPQLVEYDVRLMGDSIESNINMFLMAGKPDAAGILESSDERDGTYNQYHGFPNYLVTILNGASTEKRDVLRIRMRLNPGFTLVEEAWHDPLVFGKVYHIAYLIEDEVVTVIIDGTTVCKTGYDTKLSTGLHGLRIWRTHSVYDNFRVSRLIR